MGAAIEQKFHVEGYKSIIVFRSCELDMREQSLMREYFEEEQKGGIL